MEYSQLKGSKGFTISWGVLAISSLVIGFYDFKIGVFGLLIYIVFGFLGFDMIDSLSKQRPPKARRK